jgi:hypothetical protein
MPTEPSAGTAAGTSAEASSTPTPPIDRNGPDPQRDDRVRLLVGLMIVRALAAVIGIGLLLANQDAFKRSLLQRRHGAARARLDGDFHSVLWIAIGVAAVLIVAYVLLADQVHRGRGWAIRVVGVIAILSVLNALRGFTSGLPTLSLTLAGLNLLLDVAILVLTIQIRRMDYATTR